eukprot:7106352-Heterocapsa_arctica.AAC.1
MHSQTNRSKAHPLGRKADISPDLSKMGHEVQTCGDYEYCLGRGQNTKAKRSISATTVLEERIL